MRRNYRSEKTENAAAFAAFKRDSKDEPMSAQELLEFDEAMRTAPFGPVLECEPGENPYDGL